MWSDVETANDYLNFGEVADIAADMIRDPAMLPLSLGVFGGWGAGKSSVLRLIEKQLSPKPADSDFIIVNFDAWLFQGYDDARASLMEVIARELIVAAGENDTLRDKAKRLLARVNYLRLLGLAVEAGATVALGVPAFGAVARGVESAGRVLEGAATEEDVQQIRDGVAAGKDRISGLVNPEKSSSPPEEVLQFRDHFGQVLSELDRPLVVFIDNLDRCLPRVAIETLEAIRLVLFMPNTAFVVAADEGMIRHSVARHFDGLSGDHVTDYLDKLIQVPIRVPQVGANELRAYMFLLFVQADGASPEALERVRASLCNVLTASWKGVSCTKDEVINQLGGASPELRNRLDLAERLAPLLASAPNVSGNPRIVKRLLNTVSVRSKWARRRGISVDESIIAKLAVFERCSGEEAFRTLIDLINTAPDGAPEKIRQLEELVFKTEQEFANACPNGWKPRADFMRQWFALEPPLAQHDLRPALYLSRDNSPLVHEKRELSPRALKVLQALRACQRVNSRSATEAAASLTAGEPKAVMSALIGDLRKTATWSNRVPGVAGAVVLANAHPDAGPDLEDFFAGLPPEGVGPWIRPWVEDAQWASRLVEKWRGHPNGPMQTLAARRRSAD